MKGCESGMPDKEIWNGFFDAEGTIERLLGKSIQGNVVEFGSGYGTFSLPAARRTTGLVTALDIEPDLIAYIQNQAIQYHLNNIRAQRRDFMADGTGLNAASQAHAMIFNLLHLEHPVALLKEAYRILDNGGALSVIHWRSDIPTPRGPSLEIRPTPDQCRAWMAEVGFKRITNVDLVTTCPFHYGLIASR